MITMITMITMTTIKKKKQEERRRKKKKQEEKKKKQEEKKKKEEVSKPRKRYKKKTKEQKKIDSKRFQHTAVFLSTNQPYMWGCVPYCTPRIDEFKLLQNCVKSANVEFIVRCKVNIFASSGFSR